MKLQNRHEAACDVINAVLPVVMFKMWVIKYKLFKKRTSLVTGKE